MKKLLSILLWLPACLTTNSQTLYKSPMDLVRGKEFKIPGNLNGPYDTKIQLEENEYVFVEAIGQIKVGNYLGYADATGLLNDPFAIFNSYFKYRDIRHGSLVIIAGGKPVGCKRIFRDTGILYNNPFTPEYPDSKVTKMTLRDYIPGYYFISSGKCTLFFDINDTVLEDNTGALTVKVYTIKFKDHLNRNYFNYCPIKEPLTSKDSKRLTWDKENPVKSAVYHGVTNSSYRGDSYGNAGCQCVYKDFTNELIIADADQGSFDLGYWLFKDRPQEETTRNYFHLVLDVIPHDCYVAKFGNLKTIYNSFKNTRY